MQGAKATKQSRALKNQYSVIPAEEPESDNMFLFNEMPYPFAALRAGKSGMTKIKKIGFSKVFNLMF